MPTVAVTLGLGCDRGTPLATVELAVQSALAQAGVPMAAVVAAASIEAKADEVAFLALTRARGWPLRLYSAQALSEVPVPNPSETVRRYMGTPSVSEAAAMLAAGTRSPTDLLVEKFKCKGEDGKNATVSVARVTAARRFAESEREVVHALMQSRRDMRRFVPGATVDAEPLLSLEGWRHPRGMAAFMAENTWPLVTGDVNPDVCF